MKRINPIKFLALALCCLLVAGSAAGCGKQKNGKKELNIAIQYGVAYAPLEVMKQNGILEKYLDGVTVNWIQVNGPTEISDGILSGDIDIGFMGPAPALVGIDNNAGWKIFTGLSANEVAIVTDRDDIRSLADFTQADRIAVLSPTCTQAVLLSLASEQAFGDSHYFDNRIVCMSHPDAMNALISDTEVAAHIATPPYIQQELDNGGHILLTGEDILGMPFTFIVGVATESLYKEHQDQYLAFIQALQEAIDLINADPQAAAETLAPTYNIGADDLLAQMTYGGKSIYSTQLEGIEAFAAAMRETGYIKKVPSESDMIFPKHAGE